MLLIDPVFLCAMKDMHLQKFLRAGQLYSGWYRVIGGFVV